MHSFWFGTRVLDNLTGTQNSVTAALTNHMNPLGASWCKSQNCRIPFFTINDKNKNQWKITVKNKTNRYTEIRQESTTENVVSVCSLVQLWSATPSVRAAARTAGRPSCDCVHTPEGTVPRKLQQHQSHLLW